MGSLNIEKMAVVNCLEIILHVMLLRSSDAGI